MANRGSRTTSNAQENEGQRRPGETSAESTSLTSSESTAAETGRLSAEEEQALIQTSVDKTLGNDTPEDDGREKISVKTLGSYLVHDPTTGETVEADGESTKVTKTPFIQAQIEAGRLEEA